MQLLSEGKGNPARGGLKGSPSAKARADGQKSHRRLSLRTSQQQDDEAYRVREIG